jgi:hypothetical protein
MNRPVVILRSVGGLGNQLFAYAAARRLALASNSELVIDHISGFRYDTQYQRDFQLDHFAIPCRKATAVERLEPFSRIRRNLLRRWNTQHPFEQRGYIQQEGIDFDPRLLTLRPSGTLYLEGYWQSEGYFKDVEPQIREDLRIIPPKNDANQQMAARIQNHVAVALHVRFFDEPEQSSPSQSAANNAPGDYYQRAIAEMEQRVPRAHYFLFSDRPDAARARIPMPDERITLVHHNQGDAMAYADLWLMTQCQHFIIANSTFSWWGAWLSMNPNKLVIAPGFERRVGASSWGFRGLLPIEWVKV